MYKEEQEQKKEMTQALIDTFQNGTGKTELFQLLQLGADSMKNSTYRVMLEKDEEYQTKHTEIKVLTKIVRSMDFSKDQKEALELLLARIEEEKYHLISNAYMAGILDGYKILKEFDLTYE